MKSLKRGALLLPLLLAIGMPSALADLSDGQTCHVYRAFKNGEPEDSSTYITAVQLLKSRHRELVPYAREIRELLDTPFGPRRTLLIQTLETRMNGVELRHLRQFLNEGIFQRGLVKASHQIQDLTADELRKLSPELQIRFRNYKRSLFQSILRPQDPLPEIDLELLHANPLILRDLIENVPLESGRKNQLLGNFHQALTRDLVDHPGRPLTIPRHRRFYSPSSWADRERLAREISGNDSHRYLYVLESLDNSVDQMVDLSGFLEDPGLREGARAQVERAYDTKLGQEVAAKTSLREEERDLIVHEADVLKDLNHDHSFQGVPDLLRLDGRRTKKPRMLTKWIKGRTLGETADEWKLSEARDVNQAAKESLGFMRDSLKILQEVHRRGFVHADIKLNNIMIDDAGQIVIIDFGSASRKLKPGSGAHYEKPRSFAGYHTDLEHYSSPEQNAAFDGDDVANAFGPKSDVYSVGRSLDRLLVEIQSKGQNVAGTTELVARIRLQIVGRLSHPDPAQRLGTVEAIDAIEKLLATLP